MNKKIFFPVLFLLALLIHSHNYFNADEGVILAGAWGLFNNKELYTDIFAFIPPGSFYIILWLWKIFGAHYLIAKAFAILLIFLSALGIYKISKLFTQNKYSILPPLVFILSSALWPIINHNIFSLVFIVWSVYFALRGLSNYSRNNFIISGLLVGASLLFLQQKAIILIFSILTFLFLLFYKEKNCKILKNSIYFLSAAFLPILILFLKWPASILYKNLIIFPLFHYYETNRHSFCLLMFFLTILFLLVLLFKKQGDKKICLILYIQLFLLLSTIPRADHFHILLITFPIYTLLPLTLEKICLKYTPLGKNFLYAIIFFILLILIFPITNLFFLNSDFSNLISFIKQNCQESKYIYAGPFIPGIYFATRKLNPSPYSFLITEQQTKEQFEQAQKDIARTKPACAILNYEIVEKFNYNKNNPVDNYIKKNYEPISQFSDYLVYKIK
jgi:hypothetical protein